MSLSRKDKILKKTKYTFPEINQLSPEAIGTQSINPFFHHNSASRLQMFSSHTGQALVLANPTRGGEKRIVSGVEMDFGEYTDGIKVMEDMTVISVIHRYSDIQIGNSGFAYSPQTVVIYENKDGEIGMLDIPKYASHHPEFGYEYKPTSSLSRLSPGQSFTKDTVLMQSPSIGASGEYNYGIELNTALISKPCLAEDGIAVCRDVLPRLSYWVYEKRVVEFGGGDYPLNLYGDDKQYLIFPEIGQKVVTKDGTSGLLMCIRDYREELLGVEQSVTALRKPDPIFDHCMYVSSGDDEVVDILVYHQPPTRGESTCDEMLGQAIKYRDALLQFRNEVLDVYFKILKDKKTYGRSCSLTPEFHRFVVESMAITGRSHMYQNRQNVLLDYKKQPISEWRIEFTVRRLMLPSIGCKLTDENGGKGVITSILEPEEMPVNRYGIRADVLKAQEPIVNRMIPSVVIQQQLNSVKDYVRYLVLKLLDCDKVHLTKREAKTLVLGASQDKIIEALNEIHRYHSIVNPIQASWLEEFTYEEQIEYLISVVEYSIIDYLPADNRRDIIAILNELDQKYPESKTPVTFKDSNGQLITTKDDVRIGSIYTLLLEKTGKQWTSVSTSKTQQHGIIAYQSRNDRNSEPTKQQAVRITGESEIRVLTSHIGGKMASEIHRRSNNTSLRKAIVMAKLHSEQPTNIQDYRVYADDHTSIYTSKPLSIAKHLLQCGGIEFAYSVYDDSDYTPAPTDRYIHREQLHDLDYGETTHEDITGS